MTVNLRFVLPIVVLLFFVSCSDRTLSEETIGQLNAENEVHDWKTFIDETDAQLDINGERFESLVFTSKSQEIKSIYWYRNDTLIVIRQQVREIPSNIQHEISYYFGKRGLQLVQELVDVPVANEEMESTEYLTLYQKGQPVKTWMNKLYGSFADPLQYKETTLRSDDYTWSHQMFSLEGDFALTFDDFLVNDQDIYLLVETVSKEPYIAALKVEKLDGFLSELYFNKDKYKNRPLQIEYQVVNDQGWIFSYYKSGKFKE